MKRLTMLLEVGCGAHNDWPLRPPEGHRDHVGGYEVRPAYTKIKSVGDDVYQTSLGHEIDVRFWVAAQKLQHER